MDHLQAKYHHLQSSSKPLSSSSLLESSLPLSKIVGNAVVLLSDWEKYGLSERVGYHFDLIEALKISLSPDAPRRRHHQQHRHPQSPKQKGAAASREQQAGDSDDKKKDAGESPTVVRRGSTGAASARKDADVDETSKNNATEYLPPVCGVSGLLECIPQMGRLRGDQKRKLKSEIRIFNGTARLVQEERTVLCHQPPVLPLKISSSSNVVFAYETTRIAFCLDASPTLTSTFGFSGMAKSSADDAACCPLDRLVPMARTFFTSLARPIRIQSGAHVGDQTKAVWQPELAVSVVAVFPGSRSGPEARLLVRDYRIRDVQSAEVLADCIGEWALGEIEGEIASRLAHPERDLNIISSFEAGMVPLYASNLRDLLDAGDAALSTLSSAARPLIVLATDGRSVSCDAIIDIVSDSDRVDVPLVVLDLSSAESHAASSPVSAMEVEEESAYSNFHILSYDPAGAVFPLHLSDDAEALYGICKATDGCFFEYKLLKEASSTFAGNVDPESTLYADSLFSYKRHVIKPNAVQWYTLFSLSNLSPTINLHLGKLPPPEYIRRKLVKMDPKEKQGDRQKSVGPITARSFDRTGSASSGDARRGFSSESSGLGGGVQSTRLPQNRATFWTYIVNPIRIKGLLTMRIKEGYRAKLYGTSTNDPDKVSIQFVLPLDLGNVLHYELSYTALPGHHHAVGFAHVKIELSGEAGFIQKVKNDFSLPTNSRYRPVTMVQQVSFRLCELLRWIRREDMLQSYLSPVKWSDQLSKNDTPFVKRLGTLTDLQRRRHFRRDEFDCVCQGTMPYEETDDFLSEFREVEDGEEDMVDAIREWATQTVHDATRYVTRIQSTSLANYCVVEVSRSPQASRIFTISVETFSETDPNDRLSLVAYLKRTLGALKSVEVIPKQMGRFLVGVRSHVPGYFASRQGRLMECQHNHASWDLVKDPELFPLLMRRRAEIGNFLLLDWSDDYALFAKIIPNNELEGEQSGPGDLVQYQLAVLEDKVVVDLHMESASSEFFPSRARDRRGVNDFYKLARILRKRDQECGKALQCRTSLLKAENKSEVTISCVRRLLAYASSASVRLRFFHSGCGAANSVLRSMTEESLLSGSFGVKVAKLNIACGSDVAELEEGDWFVVEYDKQTMSLTHLSCEEKSEISQSDGKSVTYRELTFFTVAIGDLYSRRDDLADDASDEDHISEYIRVTEFSDSVQMVHNQNYASAAYVALKGETNPSVEYLNLDDFTEILRSLVFVEVATIDLRTQDGSADSGIRSKLSQLTKSVLQTIPDEDFCLYYSGSVVRETMFTPVLDDDSADSVSLLNIPLEDLSEDEDISRHSAADAESSHADESTQTNLEFSAVSSSTASAPIFIRFLLDGKPASVHDLSSIENESSLSVLISLFNDGSRRPGEVFKSDPSHLPPSHLNVAMELAGLLNAFVAEQSLERLRLLGPKIDDEGFKDAKSCLRKARDVVTSTIEVFFYVAKVDAMIPASAPAGCDAEVEVGFDMLSEQLRSNREITLEPFGAGFVAVDSELQRLAYWCFISVRRSRAVISVEIFHPDGPHKAAEVLSSMHGLISMCCHKVNQLLLLQRLHRSRVASALLIPTDDDKSTGDSFLKSESEELVTFHAGLFTCPVVFRTSFDLFHRCATNPAQVARTVEATSLHVFAISNRPHVFVYRDESGSIFYMKLLSYGGGVEADGKIDLVVYGVEEPGPSVTRQLAALLKKRLLSIAIDMLSSVLTKNPNYYWRRPDLTFVRSYEEAMSALEDDKALATTDRERFYTIPAEFDPLMLFLFFRQNFCGSTFCHVLKSQDLNTESASQQETEPTSLDSSNFVFYYNSSKVNSKFQGLSTLTDKGASYSRQLGTGIAIIEVQLVDSEGCQVKKIDVPRASFSNGILTTSPDSFCLREASLSSLPKSNDSHRIKVKITDTALKRDVLHEWIALSLNQAMLGWAVERHLENLQQRRLSISEAEDVGDLCNSEASKNKVIEAIAPGLPAFTDLLRQGCALPHPAVRQAELQGVVRSSTVASAALDLLERTIFDQLFVASKGKWTGKVSDTYIIRLSRAERPRRVTLRWDGSNKHAVVSDFPISDSASAKIIRDSPIDCPEYLCFYSSPDYVDEIRPGASPPKLFEKVSLSDGSDDTSDAVRALKALKLVCPTVFRRSFAFVFSVKRNRRVLLSYNWTKEAFMSTVVRLREKNRVLLASTDQLMNSHQRRCLRELSPLSSPAKCVTSGSKAGYETNVASNATAERKQENRRDETPHVPTARRAIRPSNIRRPKLIGKSVEGASFAAIAASRARASSKMFRGAAVGSTGTTRKGDDSRTPGRGGGALQRKGHEPLRRRLSGRSNSFAQRSSESLLSPHDDKDLMNVQMEHNSSVFIYSGTSLRLHSLQQRSMLLLSSRLWPVQPEQTILASVARFLLANASLSWSDVVELPAIPKRMIASFLVSFGRTLSAWTPGLKMLPLAMPNLSANDDNNSIIFMGELKNVRNRKCQAVVEVLVFRRDVGGIVKIFVRCNSWAVTLPRHSIPDSRSRCRHFKYNDLSLYEKDSTGIDKLLLDTHAALPLQRMLFDYLSSIAEHTMKTNDPGLRYSEALALVRELLSKYPLRRQLQMPRSNYKVYATQAVLASYTHSLIDAFEAPILFRWLYTNAQKRNLAVCGPDGLSFKCEIAVRGTHSICFFTCNATDRIDLTLLCRTQGCDILDFTFRDGSNIAVSIMDCIAIEAAGLLYKELIAAATSLRLDSLWRLVSGKRTRGQANAGPTSAEIAELLGFSIIRPVKDVVSSNADSRLITLIFENGLGTDWRLCCSTMSNDPAFSPSWQVGKGPGSLASEEEQKTISTLFYMSADDTFLLVRTDADGHALDASVVQRPEGGDSSDQNLIGVVQKLANYLLHFIWSDIGAY